MALQLLKGKNHTLGCRGARGERNKVVWQKEKRQETDSFISA